MKTKFFFLSVLILSLVNTGCDKDEKPEYLAYPKLTISSESYKLEYGEKTVIHISALNTDSIISDLPGAFKLDGSFNGSVETPELTLTTTYHFKAFGNGKVSEMILVITINEVDLSVTATPTNLIGAGTVLISWSSTNADSIKSDLPGVTGISGSLEIIPQTSGTYTYTFFAYGKGNRTTSKDVSFSVLLPTPDEALLCLAPWKMVKLQFQDTPEDTLREVEIYECLKDNLFTFYFNPNLAIYNTGEIHCYEDEPQNQQGEWTLIGDILNTGSDSFIKTLTEDTLVYWYHTGGAIQKTFETWIHP